jgi:hypothetical protein
MLLFEVVAIIPRSLTELRASDYYLREVDARRGADISHNNVDVRTEAKDEPSVVTIQNQITPREKDLAWGRDSGHVSEVNWEAGRGKGGVGQGEMRRNRMFPRTMR